MNGCASTILDRLASSFQNLFKTTGKGGKPKPLYPSSGHPLFGSISEERAARYQHHFEAILDLSPEVALAPSLESLPASLRIRIRSVMEDAHRREGINVLYLAVLIDQFLATEKAAQQRHRSHWAPMVLLGNNLPPALPPPESFFYAARSWEP